MLILEIAGGIALVVLLAGLIIHAPPRQSREDARRAEENRREIQKVLDDAKKRK